MKRKYLCHVALFLAVSGWAGLSPANGQPRVPVRPTDSIRNLPGNINVQGLPAAGAFRDVDFDNWDFENGLRGWSREGTAFNNQPTAGDNILTTRVFQSMELGQGGVGGDYWKNQGVNPGYNGRFWIGTYEKNPDMQSFLQTQGDEPTGVLISPEFRITTRYCVFRLGGGADPANLFVELQVKQPDGSWRQVQKQSNFRNSEFMQQERFDLSAHSGATARIRIVDNSRGSWGHINTDDFRFLNEEPAFIPLRDPGGREYRVDINTAVWGVADTHAHPAHDEGFGNLLIAGKATDPLHRTYANDVCQVKHGALANPAIKKPFILGADDHETGGWPDFIHFPRFHSKTHQQQQVEMLKRAFEGGLKLFCALAVNNMYVPSLFMGPGNDGTPFDDESAIVRQIEAIKRMVSQESSWMEIAYTPVDARRIILQGKMAVVLGIEVDNLGNFKAAGFNWQDAGLFGNQNKPMVTVTESNADQLLSQKLNQYRNAGIRQITPMHYISGLFGGAAVFRAELAAQQFAFNNHIEVTSGIDRLIPYSLYDDYSFLLKFSNPPLFTKEAYESKIKPGNAGSRISTINRSPMTPIGRKLVSIMMEKGFIIDSEHMGMNTKDDLFAAAYRKNYPVISSHSDPAGLSFNWTGQPVSFEGSREHKMREFGTTNIRHIANEFQLSDADFRRISRSGGTVGVFMLPYYKKAYTGPWGSVPNDCAGSTKTWAQTYLYSLDKMTGRGVALCSDRGMTDFIAPRFGVHAGYTLGDEEMWYIKRDERARQRHAQRNGVHYDVPMRSFHPAWYEEASMLSNGLTLLEFQGLPISYEEEDTWKALAAVTAGLNRSQVPDGRELTREHRIRNFFDGLTAASLDNPLIKNIHFMEKAAMYCAWNNVPVTSLPGYDSWLPVDKANINAISNTISRVLPAWKGMKGNNAPLRRMKTGNRWWDFNTDGMAHYGLMPDFFQDLRNIGLTPMQLTPLFRSAEDYIQMWEKTEIAAGLRPAPAAPPTTTTPVTPPAQPGTTIAPPGNPVPPVNGNIRPPKTVTQGQNPPPATANPPAPKDNPPAPPATGGAPATVTIGKQVWMRYNLDVTHYNDGTPIATGLTDKAWAETKSGAYAVYEGNPEYDRQFGKLYNGYAVRTGKLCPKGWRLPTDEDWKILEQQIGMAQEELNRTGGRSALAGQLKQAGLWDPSDYPQTNKSGFTALPGGLREANGDYKTRRQYALFWSSSLYENPYETYLWSRHLYYNSHEIGRIYESANKGMSCRCLQDNQAGSSQPPPAAANPPAANTPAGKYPVKAVLSGPAGATVTLLLNGKDAVTHTVNRPTHLITFPGLLNTGTPYRVTVKSAPKWQRYVITTRSGTPGIVGETSVVNVEGDWEYDLVSRGNGDSIKGTFYETRDLAVDKSLDEGRYVVFSSYAKGLCGSSGKFHQVFRRDRYTGQTIMLSRAPDGTEGNGNSFAPAIAVGGIHVAFESYATNLVPGDNNQVRDVFLWMPHPERWGTVTRVSVGPNGEEANGESYEPAISGMGHQIVFTSYASNLTGDGIRVDGVNVYVKDKTSGGITLLTRDYKTGWGTGGSRPAISFDGNRIAFCSFSPNLVPDDKNGLWDIFLCDFQAGSKTQQLRRITMAWDGSERNQGTESSSRVVTPTLSGDGRFISYATTASNVVPDDRNNVQDAFLYDTETGKTVRMSVNANGEEGNADSPVGQGEKIDLSVNGQFAAFTTNATNLGNGPQNVVLYNQQNGRLRAISQVKGTYVGVPSLSRNGYYAGYGCGQPLDGRFASSGQFIQWIKEGENPEQP